jgi:hypothetical protein
MGPEGEEGVDAETKPVRRSGPVAVEPAEFRQLVDQVERAHNLIESLTNRTNTLVHLLDILNKRVDRLEARAGT